jgi:hypothetical protein
MLGSHTGSGINVGDGSSCGILHCEREENKPEKWWWNPGASCSKPVVNRLKERHRCEMRCVNSFSLEIPWWLWTERTLVEKPQAECTHDPFSLVSQLLGLSTFWGTQFWWKELREKCPKFLIYKVTLFLKVLAIFRKHNLMCIGLSSWQLPVKTIKLMKFAIIIYSVILTLRNWKTILEG